MRRQMVTTMYNNLRYELGGASLEGLIFGINFTVF